MFCIFALSNHLYGDTAIVKNYIFISYCLFISRLENWHFSHCITRKISTLAHDLGVGSLIRYTGMPVPQVGYCEYSRLILYILSG